jgi:predicted ATPase
LEGGSVPYRKTTAYLPIIDLLRVYFQIEGSDDARRIREKVSGKLVTLDEALTTALPAFLALIDVPVDDPRWQALDPSQRRRRTMEVCERLLLRESRVQPLCLVLEDLHWIDSETQTLLEALVERLPSARILLLVSYRPEYKSPWGSKSYCTELRIDPLPPANADELLTALLGEGRDLQPLKGVLIERTNGNPFFLEENVRNLVETGVVVREGRDYRLVKALPTILVPATVQAVLAARVDRLPPEEKTILQIAAVIGDTVPFVLLQAIAGEPEGELQRVLTRLVAAEFLYQASLFPELEYTFKHALTHEVVYDSLLHEHRRRLHVQILEAIERLYPDRLPEQVERLAHHAVRGQLWEQAVTYLDQAGRKAAARSALQDARACFEQALEALATLPESQSTLEQAFEIRLKLRPVLNLLGEVRQALARLREAEALAERLDDDRRRGWVCAFVTNVHSLIGELDEALVSASKAVAIARVLGDLELRITATTYLAHAHYLRGEYDWTIDLATDNLAVLPADRVYEYFGGTSPPSVYDRMWLVMSLAQLGRFGEASEHAAEAIRLAERLQHAFTLGLAYRAASTLEFLRGDWAKARSVIERWLSVVRTGNVVLQLPRAVVSSAWVLAHFGEANEALGRLREGEQLLEQHAARGLIHNLGWDYYSLGRAYFLLGRLDEARDLGRRALEFAPRHPGFAAHAWHLLGDVAAHPDRFDAASGDAHYRQALAAAEQLGMRPLVAHCHLGLGTLYRRTDKRPMAREHLESAITMYREMDMRSCLERSEEELRGLA